MWPPIKKVKEIIPAYVPTWRESREERLFVCCILNTLDTIGATEKSFFNYTNIVIEDNGIILLYVSQVLLRKERSPAYRNVCCGTGVGTWLDCFSPI